MVQKVHAPAYDSYEYWEQRFERVAGQASDSDRTQDGVEWLGDGQNILAFLIACLEEEQSPSPRVLHLGAGVSDLGLRIASEYLKHGYDTLRGIVNVDFSPSAVAIGQKRAQAWFQAQKPAVRADGMQFSCVDLRDWQQLHSNLVANGDPFTYVVDKSTCDSLATAQLVTILAKDGHLFVRTQEEGSSPPFHDQRACPILTACLAQSSAQIQTSALDLVALHLGALCRPGALWIAFSFSSTRFDELFEVHNDSGSHCLSKPLWHRQETHAVPVYSDNDHRLAPPTYHYLHVLRRTQEYANYHYWK